MPLADFCACICCILNCCCLNSPCLCPLTGAANGDHAANGGAESSSSPGQRMLWLVANYGVVEDSSCKEHIYLWAVDELTGEHRKGAGPKGLRHCASIFLPAKCNVVVSTFADECECLQSDCQALTRAPEPKRLHHRASVFNCRILCCDFSLCRWMWMLTK